MVQANPTSEAHAQEAAKDIRHPNGCGAQLLCKRVVYVCA